jgi:creatinine amidohydrolase
MIMMNWRRYETLRPDELADIVAEAPIAYWPLGLLEHHSWHLPIGFDGLKADALCMEMAARTGGVVLPVMWWGGGGGHDAFLWTHYQDESAAGAIVANTVRQLIRFGFRAIVVLAGHYPWQQTLDAQLGPLVQELGRDVLLLWGHEGTIVAPRVKEAGDHAAYWETSFALALFPHLVDMAALRGGRAPAEAWPGGDDSVAAGVYPGVDADAASPTFSQLGRDAREADATEGRAYLNRVVEDVVSRVTTHLGT